MIVGKLMNAAMTQAMNQHQETQQKWVSVMHKFAGSYGVGLLSMSADTRIDALLRSIEAEALERLNSNDQTFSFIDDIQLKMSEGWVLSMYEILRSGCEQARLRGQDSEAIRSLRDRFALVRVPLAKYEIAWADRLKPDLEMSKVGDGPEVPPKPYKKDATYIIPRAVNFENGAVEWHAVDLRRDTMVWVNRRELADEMLAIFD